MSRKIVAFSVVSLCLFLCGCGSKDNNVDNNECLDGTCLENTNIVEGTENVKGEKNEEIGVIESDIEGFDENSEEITVAEKLDGEPIVISGMGRDDESN